MLKLPLLKKLLSFDIDETNFAIRVEQINSRLRLYPRIVLSQMAIALLLVGIMWDGASHDALLLWLALAGTIHALELLYLWRFPGLARDIVQCRQWHVRFCWFSGIVGAIWGSASLLMYVPDQMLYQMFLISVVLGISASAVTSNPVHPPSLLIHMAGLVSPLIVRVICEMDGHHLFLGGMLIIYVLFVMNAATELISTFEKSLRQRIENENLAADLEQAQSIAHIGSWRFNLATKEINWSKELYRIYGVSPDTFLPNIESFIGLIHPDDGPAMSAWIDACIAGKEPKALEFRCVWPDGTMHHIEGHGRLLSDSKGKPAGISGTGQDITERKKTETALAESMLKLEEKELAKTRFLAAASHDLRQPLAAANLFIDALKLSEQTPQQSGIINRLDQAMSAFNGMLDALLNISKLDAGTIKPKYVSVSVADVFNTLEQNYSPLAREKLIGFKLYFPLKENLFVKTDTDLLNSVLMNLVFNAIKFTAKGAVLISARKRGGEVLFQIWDTGIGISDENVRHIFDEYYQVNNAQRDRSKGLGLGLSIAQRAISLLGSKISCRSRIARGSVFEFRLPLGNVPDRHTETITQAGLGDNTTINAGFTRGKRFVLIEDDALVTQAMQDLLESLGAEVKCFNNAEYVLKHAADFESTDYFILDYMLAGKLNGIQLLNQLRQLLNKPVRAVLLTGDTSSGFMQHAAECDWPVLHKPVNAAVLLDKLSQQI